MLDQGKLFFVQYHNLSELDSQGRLTRLKPMAPRKELH